MLVHRKVLIRAAERKTAGKIKNRREGRFYRKFTVLDLFLGQGHFSII